MAFGKIPALQADSDAIKTPRLPGFDRLGGL